MAGIRKELLVDPLSQLPVKSPVSTCPPAPESQSHTKDSDLSSQPLQVRLRKLALINGSGTPFSNFYSPKNDFFYSKSPYMTLDTRRREIRLLRVFPPKTYEEHIKTNLQWTTVLADGPLNGDGLANNDEAVLQEHGIPDSKTPLMACEMVDKVALSRVDADYCALSYCAGSPKNTAVILVDGLPFNAFANLEHAMRHAHEAWTSRNPGKEFFLWADQICINQRDHIERSNQVQMMRDVYRRSNETFICLSTPSLENHLSWIPEGVRRTPQKDSTPHEDSQPLDAVSELKTFIQERYGGRRPISADDYWLDSVDTFVSCSWWRRSWVYQEFIVSPRPCFLSGSDAALWNDLHPLMTLIAFEFVPFVTRLLFNAADTATEEQARRRKEMENEAVMEEEVNQRLQEEYEIKLQEYDNFLSIRDDQLRKRERIHELMMKSINEYDNHRSPRGNAKAVETHTKHVEVYRAKVEECRERIAYNSGRVQLHEKRVKHYQKIVIDDRKEVLRHLDRFSEGTEQSGTGKPDDNHQQVVERKELQEAEEKVKDSEKKLEDAKAALEEVMGEKALEQARSDLRSAEHGLGGAEWALQQMETLGQLIRLPMDDLIDVILNRVESDVCAILPDIDRLWLARILCYSRHCTEHGLLFRYEGNKRESAAAPRQNCECQVRDTCPRTIIWIKTLREYTVTPMVEPKPPDMIPVLSFDEATARDEWRELQERVVFLRKRIRQLDFSVISSTVTSKNAARRKTDLKTALQHSRNCLASDPCDRVYAFLGLADKGYSIVPDYRIENSIVHVLIETAQRIILYEKKLDILRFTSQGRTKLGSFLPSWVPDWTSEEDEASRSFTEYCKLHVTDLEQESQLNSPFAASKGLPFEVDFRRDEANESNLDLKVTGIYIDILDELETTFKGPPGLQSFLTSNGKRIITMKSALVDDEVWVLSGATKPVILRSEEDDMYGFLSEALMLEKDGFSSDGMFGGSVDLPSHQAREIWLL